MIASTPEFEARILASIQTETWHLSTGTLMSNQYSVASVVDEVAVV